MLTDEQKADFCAIMLQKYKVKIDMDNELLPIFLIAYRSAILSEQNIKRATEKIQAIVIDFEKNKTGSVAPKQFRFNSSKEAFWFAFGWIGLPVTVMSLLLFLVWLTYRF